MIRGVGDPVGRLVFSALGRAVCGEEGFKSLRLFLHVLDGSFDSQCWGFSAFRWSGGTRGSGHIWVGEERKKSSCRINIRNRKNYASIIICKIIYKKILKCLKIFNKRLIKLIILESNYKDLIQKFNQCSVQMNKLKPHAQLLKFTLDLKIHHEHHMLIIHPSAYNQIFNCASLRSNKCSV